jgi:ABC-type antimicrobial peptide transport system permease subunit
MSPEQTPTPPRWAERLVEWYCRQELCEDLLGDLRECFARNAAAKGTRRAKLIFIVDVFKFFRPYTIRKPEFINFLIHWIMIGSYIRTSGRSLMRNRLFSGINIFGLAVSMSVGLLLIGLLSDMSAYDRFHQNGDRIYRVISQYTYLGETDNTYYASTSPLAGKDIAEQVPGIDAIARLYGDFNGDVRSEQGVVPLSGFWADSGFLKVFTFPLTEGDEQTALTNPFSLVLTESSAKKIFGDRPALGKTVTIREREYTITGVMKDLPKFSHIRFEVLTSLSTREVTQKDTWAREMRWSSMWMGYTYLLLPENADMNNIRSNLDVLAKRNDKTVENTQIRLALQPLYDIALGEDLNNSIGPVMSTGEVRMIAILAVVILLSACFNYTNLSIAKITRRSKEVGIRKVIGAQKGHVLGQFMVEAVIISLLALVMAYVIFLIAKPYFLMLQPKMNEMLLLNLSPKVVVYFILLSVGVGLAAGFLPAFHFSRLNATRVLKDSSSLRVLGFLNMRKALIVLQFTVSLAFIAATIIGARQYNFMLSYDLGYTTDNIVNIDLQGNRSRAQLLANDLRSIPEVQNVSESAIVTSTGSHWGLRAKYKDPTDSAWVDYNGVDENYIPLHDIQLIAGRNFTPLPDSATESEVIVDQLVLKRFNIGNGDPSAALDEILELDHQKMKIVGVLGYYHYTRATAEPRPVVLRYHRNKGNNLNVKIATTDWPSTMQKLESKWKQFDDVHPFTAELYSDRIANSYHNYSATMKMIGVLAFLAICISSLGLLGMVIFMTETRRREVSIRKVMGAGEGNLVYMLSKGFFLLLLISGAIALPLTYLYFERFGFQEMKNHITIGPLDLLTGFFGVLIVAVIMIGSQTLKVARSNPAEVLKNE